MKKATRYIVRGRTGIAVLTLLLLAAGTANALPLDVRVDFGTSAGSPTGWTTIEDPSNTSAVHHLIDFNTGQDSGITLQFTDAFLKSGNIAAVVPWNNPQGLWVDPSVLRDYAYLDTVNTTAEIVLGGLSVDHVYQVEVLAVRDHSTFAGNETYRINLAPGVIVDGGGIATTWSGKTNGFDHQDFMRWNYVVPNDQGQIAISVKAGSGKWAFVNGLRVTAVPEPSSLALSSLALLLGVGMVWSRRTKTAG